VAVKKPRGYKPGKEELDRALQEIRDKHPLPSQDSFNAGAFMQDEEAWGALMDYVAAGNSTRAFVREIELPQAAITKLNRYLAQIKPGHPRYDSYMEAKTARAHQFAERMLDITEQVEMGVMTSQQGGMAVKALQWLAARIAPEHFGNRINIDANVKVNTADMHLEAVRMMSTMVIEDRPGNVYQGETVVEETPPPIEDPYLMLE